MTARWIGPSRVSASWTSLRKMMADERFGPKVPACNGPAVIRLAHPPLDERGDPVRLLEGDVEGGLADDGLAVGDQARRWG